MSSPMDAFVAMLKDAGGRSVKAGLAQFVEEGAEKMSADELGKLIAILQKVEKRKRGTVTVTATSSTSR